MNWIRLTVIALQGIPQRLGSTFVLFIGIAGFIGILVGVAGMSQSLSATFNAASNYNRALVLAKGALYEGSSYLSREQIAQLYQAPGISRTENGQVAASPELLGTVNVRLSDDDVLSGVVVRGIASSGFAVRPEIELSEGRWATPGLFELLVGRRTREQFAELDLDDEVLIRNTTWRVVGIYETGDFHEGEVIADAETLMSVYEQNYYNSALVHLDSEADFEALGNWIEENARTVELVHEPEYYRSLSEGVSGLRTIALSTGFIMALGGVFCVLGVMYSTVEARHNEIAVQKALGFRGAMLFMPIVAEAVLIAAIAAATAIGAVVAVFQGGFVTIGLDAASVTYEFAVQPDTLLVCVLVALGVAVVGAIVPAVQAARLSPSDALRTL